MTINFDNIEPAFHNQFEKSKTNNELGEYDYKSVMQYPSWGFSKDPFQKITMSTKNPLHQFLIDEERQGLTFRDIKVTFIVEDRSYMMNFTQVMNKLYECDSVCPRADECNNGGYRIPFGNRGRRDPCPCICPPCKNLHIIYEI